MSDTPAVKLTKRQIEALDECARFAARRQAYWWRRASMASLEAIGMVERRPHGANPRLDSYVPTEKGRALLDALKEEGDAA